MIKEIIKEKTPFEKYFMVATEAPRKKVLTIRKDRRASSFTNGIEEDEINGPAEPVEPSATDGGQELIDDGNLELVDDSDEKFADSIDDSEIEIPDDQLDQEDQPIPEDNPEQNQDQNQPVEPEQPDDVGVQTPEGDTGDGPLDVDGPDEAQTFAPDNRGDTTPEDTGETTPLDSNVPPDQEDPNAGDDANQDNPEDGPLDIGDDTGDFDAGIDDGEADGGSDAEAPADGDDQNALANNLENQLKYVLYRNMKSLYLAVINYQNRLDEKSSTSYNYNLVLKACKSKLSDIEDVMYEYMTIKFKDETYLGSMNFYKKCVTTVKLIFNLIETNKDKSDES